MHVVGAKALIGAVVSKFVDADEQRFTTFGDLKRVSDVVSVAVAEDDVVGAYVF